MNSVTFWKINIVFGPQFLERLYNIFGIINFRKYVSRNKLFFYRKSPSYSSSDSNITSSLPEEPVASWSFSLFSSLDTSAYALDETARQFCAIIGRHTLLMDGASVHHSQSTTQIVLELMEQSHFLDSCSRNS